MHFLIGDPNDAVNQWLNENPVVLGAGAMVFAVIFLFLGIRSLRSGTATTKYGQKVEGPMAYVQGGAFTIFGVLAAGFGIYKIGSGLFG